MSCGKKGEELEDALTFAKGNRIELEKVLKHYDGNDSLKLKYKAACFLIVNMKNHWYYDDDILKDYRDNFYETTIRNNCTGDSALTILEKKYGRLSSNQFNIVYDSQVITADYLIKNIDFSFNIWKRQPWGKHISFDQFCEEILPYRIGHEPIESWKEKYYTALSPVLDTITLKKVIDPVKACIILYKFITKKNWILYSGNPIPQMGAIVLLKSKIGSCEDRTDLATYAMRSIGIPGGVDLVLQYPNRRLAHSWNYVTDTLGNCVPYDLYDNAPNTPPQFEWKKGRVYRKCYSVQENSLPIKHPELEIPPPLKNIFINDVSEKYDKGVTVAINTNLENSVLFLNTFNNKEWFPIAWAERGEGKVTFYNVESGIVYLPCYYEGNTFHSISSPFMVNPNGDVHFFEPNVAKKQFLELYRKYSIEPWWIWIKNRAIGGAFQVSNTPGFENMKTILTIKENPGMLWHQFDVSLKEKYRYFRYLSADSGSNNMAEIELLSSTGLSLKGRVIGTPGSYANESKHRREAVFDGDPVTYFDANVVSGAWSGLDLGSKYMIGRVAYIFRNDDNGVKKGDDYELFYWNKEWVSIGTKTATESKLIFGSCPTKALFLLKNMTRGTEERIFSYENGKQIWW